MEKEREKANMVMAMLATGYYYITVFDRLFRFLLSFLLFSFLLSVDAGSLALDLGFDRSHLLFFFHISAPCMPHLSSVTNIYNVTEFLDFISNLGLYYCFKKGWPIKSLAEGRSA